MQLRLCTLQLRGHLRKAVQPHSVLGKQTQLAQGRVGSSPAQESGAGTLSPAQHRKVLQLVRSLERSNAAIQAGHACTQLLQAAAPEPCRQAALLQAVRKAQPLQVPEL